MADKRLYKRKLVNARVKLLHDSFGEVESVTKDISNGGVYVITKPEHEVAIGEQLKMVLLESSDTKVMFNMEVIRHDKGGMGLMFLSFEAGGQQYEMSKLSKFRYK